MWNFSGIESNNMAYKELVIGFTKRSWAQSGLAGFIGCIFCQWQQRLYGWTARNPAWKNRLPAYLPARLRADIQGTGKS
jgi:hypothetical protein